MDVYQRRVVVLRAMHNASAGHDVGGAGWGWPGAERVRGLLQVLFFGVTQLHGWRARALQSRCQSCQVKRSPLLSAHTRRGVSRPLGPRPSLLRNLGGALGARLSA